MNPDFVSVPERSTVEQAIELVRRSEIPAERLETLVVIDDTGHFAGTVPVGALVKGGRHEGVSALADTSRPVVFAETDLPEVARLMTDFNLMSLPVVDADGTPVGLLAVDDVLELLLPEEWRRRFGLARD